MLFRYVKIIGLPDLYVFLCIVVFWPFMTVIIRAVAILPCWSRIAGFIIGPVLVVLVVTGIKNFHKK